MNRNTELAPDQQLIADRVDDEYAGCSSPRTARTDRRVGRREDGRPAPSSPWPTPSHFEDVQVQKPSPTASFYASVFPHGPGTEPGSATSSDSIESDSSPP